MSLFRTAVSKILTLLLHTLLQALRLSHCMTDVLLYETHHLLTMLFLVQSIQAVAVLSLFVGARFAAHTCVSGSSQQATSQL